MEQEVNMVKKKKRRRLATIQVTQMTYRHLCEMAFQGGLEWPGQVVDKLIRSYQIGRHDVHRGNRYEDQS